MGHLFHSKLLNNQWVIDINGLYYHISSTYGNSNLALYGSIFNLYRLYMLITAYTHHFYSFLYPHLREFHILSHTPMHKYHAHP